MALLRYYHDNYPEGLRKTTENLSYNSQCPDQDFNCVPLKCKSEVLPIEPTSDIPQTIDSVQHNISILDWPKCIVNSVIFPK
jgi:hypothetical protein